MIELDEESIRQLMASAHGEVCGAAILDSVGQGKHLVVLRSDGTSETIITPSQACTFLLELGWKTNRKTTPLPRHRRREPS